MPNEDKTISGCLVLDLRIWWRHVYTLYAQKLQPQGLHDKPLVYPANILQTQLRQQVSQQLINKEYYLTPRIARIAALVYPCDYVSNFEFREDLDLLSCRGHQCGRIMHQSLETPSPRPPRHSGWLTRPKPVLNVLLKVRRCPWQGGGKLNKMSFSGAVGRRFNSTCDHRKRGQQPGFKTKD